jgi:hypothetical protein
MCTHTARSSRNEFDMAVATNYSSIIDYSRHCDVMVASRETGPNAHPFWYVLGVFHTRVLHTGQRIVPYNIVEFLWVRWFGIVSRSQTTISETDDSRSTSIVGSGQRSDIDMASKSHAYPRSGLLARRMIWRLGSLTHRLCCMAAISYRQNIDSTKNTAFRCPTSRRS